MHGHESKRTDDECILEVRGLTKHFPITAGLLRRVVGHVRAVDDVNLDVKAGETLSLVGESGSGKTTLGRMIVRAIEPTRGEIMLKLDGATSVDLAKLRGEELRATRRHYHMIFQDPSSSLNPRMRVSEIVMEPLIYNKIASGPKAREMVRDTLKLVGLQDQHMTRYPHAFSGGQRQRIGIARSLVCQPKLIVCDESVSALDVSIQAQILNLLKDLQKQMGLSYLFIAHDLSVVEHISDRVAVMYVGKVVEVAETRALFEKPLMPYTEALLSSVPIPDPDRMSGRITLKGEVPNPANPPSGCYFHPRCPYATERCVQEAPPLREVVPGRFAACHYAETLNLRGMLSLHPKETAPSPAPSAATTA
jgi:peptide/nickel transport system ATP-binding protein